MAPGKISADTKVIIVAVIAILACGIFYYYYTRPVKKEIASMQEEIDLLDIKVTSAQQYIGKLDTLKKETAFLASELAELKTMLPNRKETPSVIRHTFNMAAQSGLRLTGFTPHTTVAYDYYEAWPIELTMEGSFHNLSNFFEKTGNFRRIINITDMEITALTEGAKPGKTIKASCEANTYVYIE